MISIGQVISGKYKLLRLLGDGGMGSVYEAQHEVLGTRVAIKVLHADLARRPGLIERFLQEARVAAQIESPNVVRVSDVDRTPDGIAYLVMELLQGEPLSAVLERDRKVAIPTSCEYARQILTALEAAHALGVTHRDLKPENVFVTFSGGKPVVKIIDFGIAKLRAPTTSGRSLTQAGITMGTAEYMAPEQAFSADKADARSDIYAVGVMLYEMVAGERPASGDDARVIAVKVERGEVKPLVHAAPDVPRELAGLVHRAMAARPEVRFQTATEMRLALEKVSGSLGMHESVRPPTKPVTAQGIPAAHPATSAASPQALANPAPSALAQPPQASVAPAQPPGRGTVMAAPPAMDAYVAPPITERTAPPGPSPAMSMQASGSSYMAPAQTATPAYAPPPARRKGTSKLWLLVIPLLLGVGVVVTLVIVQSQTGDTQPQPLFTVDTTTPTVTPTTPTAQGTDTTQPQPNGTIAPLLTSNGTGTPVKPPATGTAHPTAQPSQTSQNPPTLPIPSTLPSGFPTAFPSNLPFPLPSNMSLPSGFPPFNLPPAQSSPAPTSPGPASSI